MFLSVIFFQTSAVIYFHMDRPNINYFFLSSTTSLSTFLLWMPLWIFWCHLSFYFFSTLEHIKRLKNLSSVWDCPSSTWVSKKDLLQSTIKVAPDLIPKQTNRVVKVSRVRFYLNSFRYLLRGKSHLELAI